VPANGAPGKSRCGARWICSRKSTPAILLRRQIVDLSRRIHPQIASPASACQLGVDRLGSHFSAGLIINNRVSEYEAIAALAARRLIE
jgi:hypothetical protein